MTVTTGQNGLELATIDTPAGKLLLMVIVTVLLVAGLLVVQRRLEVKPQVT